LLGIILGNIPTTNDECEHFIVGDGCLISLEETWNADVLILFDTSISINEEEYGWLKYDLSNAVLQTFPTKNANYAFVP
jgi:hypothetical protein